MGDSGICFCPKHLITFVLSEDDRPAAVVLPSLAGSTATVDVAITPPHQHENLTRAGQQTGAAKCPIAGGLGPRGVRFDELPVKAVRG